MARVVQAVQLQSPTRTAAASSLPPIYNEHGVELQQPITIHPLTGKPRVKRQFARRYASLILAHVARQNAARAAQEALEYRAKKKVHMELLERQARVVAAAAESSSGSGGASGRKGVVSSLFSAAASASKAAASNPKRSSLNLKSHSRKLTALGLLTSMLAAVSQGTAGLKSERERALEAEERARAREAAELEERIRQMLGEDPTHRGLDTVRGAASTIGSGDNSSQIEALHQAGNIFNAVLRHDRKAIDALLRADPHVLSTRGPVGELPLHMCFLYGSPAHHVLGFYLMAIAPHLVTETYLGTEYTGENILHIVIIQQNLRMVERLVRMEPSLMQARATGNFFAKGNASGCYYGETPLNFAACTGQEAMVAFLIKVGGIDALEAADRLGNNILHLMVLHSRPQMFQLVKSEWIRLNEARPPHKRATGNRVLWMRRNAQGLTPLTLSAAEGNLMMFSFLLEEDKQMQWSYGPCSCWVYPLDQIDMPLRVGGNHGGSDGGVVQKAKKDSSDQNKQTARIKDSSSSSASSLSSSTSSSAATADAASSSLSPSSASPSDGGEDDAEDDDGDDEDEASIPRALELIVTSAHLPLLMHPRMLELIKQKWDRFAARIFFQRFLIILLYLVLFTATTIHRQSENIRGVRRMHHFADVLDAAEGLQRQQHQAIQQRQDALDLVHAQAVQMIEQRRAASGGAEDDGTPAPDLASIEADILASMQPPLSASVGLSFPQVDLPSLRVYLERESAKAAPRLSALRAASEGEAEAAHKDAGPDSLQQRMARMSEQELRELLRPPPPLLDDGVLNGLGDLLLELLHSPPMQWTSLLWARPCILLACEVFVALGALFKFHVEVGEMREQGCRSYFGTAGSALFENTLSLTFSSLMIVVLLLSAMGSTHARVLQGLAAMVGWSYLFFFLLASRFTGPMVVMISSMLSSDVMRFLSVFFVFLLGFAQAFFVLFAGDGFAGFGHAMQTCFLAMLGDFALDEFALAPFPLVSVGLLVSYVLVVSVLLLNMLVAMMGSTYNRINEAAEMQWHLERARIVFAIEHEMGDEERAKPENKYWTEVNGQRYLQVLVEDPNHFRKPKQANKDAAAKEAQQESKSSSAAASSTAGAPTPPCAAPVKISVSEHKSA